MSMSQHEEPAPAGRADDERDLRHAWQARSLAAGWPATATWWVPAVDGCVSASYDLDRLMRACERLAAARAAGTISFDEALADLDALWNEIATVDAPPDFVRAFAVAWSNRRAI